MSDIQGQIDELTHENDTLGLKLGETKDNVSSFIRDMNSILDAHELYTMTQDVHLEDGELNDADVALSGIPGDEGADSL